MQNGFKKLLENVAMGANDEDTISSLVSRLSKLALNATTKDNELVRSLSAVNAGENDTNGKDLRELAQDLQKCIDSDFCAGKSESKIEKARDCALMPFNNPLLRQHLLDLAKKNFIYIDDISVDEVITGEFSKKNAQAQITSFREFINAHKDELDALSIIYHQSYQKRKLTRALIDELHERLKFAGLHITGLWNAYALTQKERVKPLKSTKIKLTNLIQLVRFELGFDSELRNFCCVANSRFELFKGR